MNNNNNTSSKLVSVISAILVVMIVVLSFSFVASAFSDISLGGNSSTDSKDDANQGTNDNTNQGTNNNNQQGSDNTGTDTDSGSPSTRETYILSLQIIKSSGYDVFNNYEFYLNNEKLENIKLREGRYYNIIEIDIKENDVLYIKGATLGEWGGSPIFCNKNGKYSGVVYDTYSTLNLPLANYKLYTAGSEKGEYNYDLTIVFTR